VIAKDPQELQDTVKELYTESERIGLKMNITKIKTPFANTTTQSNIVVDKESLDQVDQYTYLGQNKHANGGQEKEVQRRVAVTWGKFGKLSQYLQTRKFPFALRFSCKVLCQHSYMQQKHGRSQKTLGCKIRST